MGFGIGLFWVDRWLMGWSMVDGLFVGLARFWIWSVSSLMGFRICGYKLLIGGVVVGFVGLGLLSCGWSVGYCGLWWVVFSRGVVLSMVGGVTRTVLLKARLSVKRRAHSPWGFFPLKWNSLTKTRFKRAFLSFLYFFFFKKILIWFLAIRSKYVWYKPLI